MKNMPKHLPRLPKGYIYLGKGSEIKVPAGWTQHPCPRSDYADFAYFCDSKGKWAEFNGYSSIPSENYYASKPSGLLYKLNLPTPETVLERPIDAKIASLQEQIAALDKKVYSMTAEVNKVVAESRQKSEDLKVLRAAAEILNKKT